MSEFAPMPTALAEQLQPLPQELGVRGNQARLNLARKGLFVFSGLTREIVSSTGIMAQQPHITEFCPNDSNRFGSIQRAEGWVKKHGGRAFFPLMRYVGEREFDFSSMSPTQLELMVDGVHPDVCRQVGSGWTGHEPSEQKKTAMPFTFAERLSQETKGQRASVDYAVMIVAGTAAMHGVAEIGCQTWKSNNASNTYERAGFHFVPGTEETAMRPTLVRPGPEKVEDVRLFMAFDPAMLDTPMPRDLLAA